MGRWVWGGGSGVGMEDPTHVQNFTYLEPYSSLFVQSVIFGHSLCGLLNKLEGVGKCVWVWFVRSCGCGVWVCWGGCGCGRCVWEVSVGKWVWVQRCGCGEVYGYR